MSKTNDSATSGQDHVCEGCGGGNTTSQQAARRQFVYALGTVEVRFPNLGLEKEYAQIVRGTNGAGLTDRQLLVKVLSQSQNRYIARQLCWVFRVEGLETYLLVPRESRDLDMLIEALRPTTASGDIDIVVGEVGPMAPPSMCNGLTLPIVAVDQLYSLDRETLLDAIPKPKELEDTPFKTASNELLTSVLSLADNAGGTDEHRALNYVLVRYPGVYAVVAEAFTRNASLANVEVRPSALHGTRQAYDVIFTFVDRKTDVAERFSTRVDVTDEFPFLMKKISRYYRG